MSEVSPSLISEKFDSKISTEENSKVDHLNESKLSDNATTPASPATPAAAAAASSEAASIHIPQAPRANDIMDGFVIESLSMSDGTSGQTMWESGKQWSCSFVGMGKGSFLPE